MATEIDCIIGGELNVKIRAGETWQISISFSDANSQPIPLAGFIIGPLEVIDKKGTVIFSVEPEEFQVNGDDAIITKDTPEDLLKSLPGHKLKCPLMPPGGSPRAIIVGKFKVA